LDIHQLMPPSHRESYTRLLAMCEDGSKTGVSGCLVGDVSQTVGRLRAGPWLPTAQRSSSFISASKKAFFTPDELSFAMGWPMIAIEGSKLSKSLKATVPDVIANLNTQESRHLSGNGMMIAQVVAWILYTQSNCVRREVLLRIMMPTPALDANSNAAHVSGTDGAHASETLEDGAKPAPSALSKV
jgi:hypothetical protein